MEDGVRRAATRQAMIAVSMTGLISKGRVAIFLRGVGAMFARRAARRHVRSRSAQRAGGDGLRYYAQRHYDNVLERQLQIIPPPGEPIPQEEARTSPWRGCGVKFGDAWQIRHGL
ncbi:MAG: hypothetical protein N2444_05890, partial [Methylocystis sp.]|nr:hypothetical protein [Methylocystis sp.]